MNTYWNRSRSHLRQYALVLSLLLGSTTWCFADNYALPKQRKPLHVDHTLTLAQVITTSLKHYPDYLIKPALEQEANALQQRGDSWLAEAPSIAVSYEDDWIGDDTGYREIESELELPLWNWQQRAAGQTVANRALNSAQLQLTAIKLEVAGLVREALWGLALKTRHYAHVQSMLANTSKFLDKIKRRVALNDVSRTDLLLAQAGYLQQKAQVTEVESEMMRASRNYVSLTQRDSVPLNYQESVSPLTKVPDTHPRLAAINAVIQRQRAELEWVKSQGSGQSVLSVGGKTGKDDEYGDDMESVGVAISIPFGGGAHLAPEIAELNLELTETLAQRAHLHRELAAKQREATHNLALSRVNLGIVKELKKLAAEHVAMTKLRLSAGEASQLNLLKLQAELDSATFHVEEHEMLVQMRIALYNQAVGILP